MTEFFRSMAYPFLACLVLTGIHVYLGIHVISRKVIFVDLALATFAALGAVWGALLGWDIHDDVWVIKGFSLAFTFLAAAVFSLTRMRHERVPHEAIIGITYAVALSAIILGSARLPHGAEEVRDLQAGSILWVSGSTLLSTAILYTLVGAFHYVFRRRFFAISLDPEGAEARGLNVRLWDFLFYVSFGFVVTSSVAIAGVLLVFSFLVIPSVIGVLFAERIGPRLAIGWTVGTLVSAIGVTVSYFEDLPSGPVIVVGLGICLTLAGIVHYLIHTQDRGRALLRVVGGATLFGALLLGSRGLKKREEHDIAHLLETGSPAEQMRVIAQVTQHPADWKQVEQHVAAVLRSGPIEVRLALLDLVSARAASELLGEVHALLRDPDDVIREAALKCVRILGRRESVEPIAAAAADEEDEYIRVELAETLLELGDSRGVPLLFAVMRSGDARQARRDAWEHLSAHVRTALGYHPEADDSARAAEVDALETWWRAEGSAQPLIGVGTGPRG